MKITARYALGLALTFLCAQGVNAYDGPREKLHIYLLIGQSNMAGRAAITKAETGPIDQTYLLDDEDQWEKAENPLNRYSTIRKGLNMQKLNPGYRFAQTMVKEDDASAIGLVVNAKGGTSIREWAKGSKFYNEALRRTGIARKTGELKGILWHQGESDSKDSQYLEKLKTLIADLRADLDAPDLPFVAGQLIHNPKLINEQLLKLPDEVPFTGCVSSEGLTSYDNTHFDTEGMLLLGERYAVEMLKIHARQKTESTELKYRNWTNDQGNTIEAAFLGLSPKGVRLRLKNGRDYTVPLEKFDKESQALAKSLGE